MVRQIKTSSGFKGYYKQDSKGRNIPINRDGSIKEQHEIWDEPVPKHPESKPKDKLWEPPFVPYEHPPDYLVPAGGGFYLTPDTKEVMDPQNCEGALADISPWCGGNPFSRDFLTLDPEIKFDECNVWAQVNPTFAFMKLTPFTIAYRFPGECRNEPPPPTPPPPGESGHTFDFPSNVPDDALVYAFVGGSDAGGYNYTKTVNGQVIYCTYQGSGSFKWTNYHCPGMFQHHKIYYGSGANDWYWYDSPINGNYTQTTTTTDPCYLDGQADGTDTREGLTHWDENSPLWSHLALAADGRVVWYTNPTFSGTKYLIAPPRPPVVAYVDQLVSDPHDYGIYYGSWSSIRLFFNGLSYFSDDGGWASVNHRVDYVVLAGCGSPKDRRKLPPPPLEKDKHCCMACCNQPNNQDNALLKEILAQVKKANKAIGSDEFPATFPSGLTKSERDNNVEIPNLAQLGRQQVIYLDNITGQYSIEIEVEDINPTQEGNQSQTFELKNQAETLAEMFGMQINNSMNSELLVQLAVKSLIEAGVMRQQVHNTQSQVKAIADYFGFKADEKSEEVPFTFTVPQSDNINNFKMEDFLKDSKQKVEIVKLDSKEVGKHKIYMLLLEKTAGIIKAVFWRNLGKDAAQVAGKVKDLLKKQDATIKQIDKHDEELERVLEDFERGYTDYSPYVGDSSKPYGEDYATRPKTRIIKKPTPGEGSGNP